MATHRRHASSYADSRSVTQRLVSNSAQVQRLLYSNFRSSPSRPTPSPWPDEFILYENVLASLMANSSYWSSSTAMSSAAALRPSSPLGRAPFRIEAAIREHILYLYRGRVSRGVLDHKTSAAVVCALHSGVSRNKSQTRALDMCWCLGATSVNQILDATLSPAHSNAVRFKLLSPRSGNRRSHKIALGTLSSILNHVRKVVGSICS